VRRLAIDDDDRDTVNASVSSEEPVVEDGVFVAVHLHRFGDFAREQLPYDVVHVFNRFLRQLCEPALANRGSVLRYEPSGVLLSFGSGEATLGALEDAVRSALRAQARVKQLNGYVLRHFGQQIGVAIGLHAGRIMRASVGNAARSEQLIIGEGVEGAQVASREAATLGLGVVSTGAALKLAAGTLKIGVPVELSVFGAGAEIVDFTRPDVNLLVQSTFERLEGRWPEFSTYFYDQLFSFDPNIEPLFSHVDMEVQRTMLGDVLTAAIRGLDQFEALIPTLRDLGARHVAYGARNNHYKLVGRALLDALEHFLGAEFTPEVHLAWLEVYGALAREMIDGSREAAAGG
jgi:hemoglobin-like flavoprotein/class 3 adenylate cyclase